jgi:hypothetical protein
LYKKSAKNGTYYTKPYRQIALKRPKALYIEQNKIFLGMLLLIGENMCGRCLFRSCKNLHKNIEEYEEPNVNDILNVLEVRKW